MNSGYQFNKKRAIYKLLILTFGFVGCGVMLLYFLGSGIKAGPQRRVAKFSLQTQNNDGARVFAEPKINITLQTTTEPVNVTFLVDSGSTISSLSFEYAQKLGYDIKNLKRVAFSGYGNSTVFAYEGQMRINVADEEINLPVVFTENPGTTALLGRRGFFDNYSIIFDYLDHSLEIKK